MEDVKALGKTLFHSPLQLNEEKVVNCSGVISVGQAIASTSYLDRRHEIEHFAVVGGSWVIRANGNAGNARETELFWNCLPLFTREREN